MRYVLHEKLLSWGDDFTIKDENERDVFFVDGKAFSLGNQLSFQDMAGNELCYIKQRLLSWGPTYELFFDGELYAQKTFKYYAWSLGKLREKLAPVADDSSLRDVLEKTGCAPYLVPYSS